MKTLKRYCALWLFLTILSVMLSLAAIPGIIISARSSHWLWFTLCLVALIWGMYGTQFLLISYQRCNFVLQMLLLITRKKVYLVKDLSARLCRSPEQVRKAIAKQIHRHHLTGFSFDGEQLYPINETQN